MLEAGQVASDRYRLQQRLGRNAGRQTWLAEDLQTENSQLVVVKLLAFGGDIQWEDLKLFEREANILKQLAHPRIPKYRDYFSIDDRTLWFGLVQEYIPGSSLKEILEGGKRFTEVEVRQIATQLLQILLYLHGLHPPLLHRDIKPNNLIWGKDEQVYLVDFGAVQDRAAIEGATFTVVGTYGYAPMEQFGGRAVPASDLYALGATLIHLLARTAPADLPNSDLKIQFRHCLELDPRLANWLEKMTAPALERRFKTAKQALEALELSFQKNSSFSKNFHFSNFIAQNFSRNLKKPINTNIKINHYSKFLEIYIPRRGINNLNDIGNIVILAIIAGFLPFFVLATPVFIIVLLLFYAAFYPHLKQIFLSTKIKITPHIFEIKTNFLGLSNCQRGITEEIQDVSVNYQSTGTSSKQLKTDSLIINTKSSSLRNQFTRYFFGQGLTEEELIWLANEIRGWLAERSKI
ncbi:protein kinase [Pleurocapsales cyanobacterium LEGE 06147]|nr:protein kinase [Pleurocapsales cyanobacterium LEGE 06147]